MDMPCPVNPPQNQIGEAGAIGPIHSAMLVWLADRGASFYAEIVSRPELGAVTAA